jgi:hypothetical protein
VYACRVSNGRVIKYDLTIAKDKPQDKSEIKMAITSELIREIFKGLENADGATLFKQVVDDVDWTVTGTRPLVGHYPGKNAFIEGTSGRAGSVQPPR